MDGYFFLDTRTPYLNMNCHPDRSEAKWRDLRFSFPATQFVHWERFDLPLSGQEKRAMTEVKVSGAPSYAFFA